MTRTSTPFHKPKKLRRLTGVVTGTALTLTLCGLVSAPAHADEYTNDLSIGTPQYTYLFATGDTRTDNPQATVSLQVDPVLLNAFPNQQAVLYKVGSATPVGSYDVVNQSVGATVTRPDSGFDQYYFELGGKRSDLVTVSGTNNPWTASLMSNNPLFSTDNSSPTLNWSFSQDPSTSGEGLYIVDQQSGDVVYKTQNPDQNGSFTIPRFYSGTRDYEAYLADWNSAAANVSDLTNTQIASDGAVIVPEHWWAGISVDNSQRDPVLSITLNQSIQNDANAENPYSAYIVDTTTNTVLAQNSTMGRSDTWKYQVLGLADHELHKYQLVIAARTSTMPTDPSALQDVQYKSVLTNARGDGWTVDLTTGNENYSTADPSPTITWNVNQSMDANPDFGIYIVNGNTGQVIQTIHSGGTSGSFVPSRDINDYNGSYQAYVHTWDPNITNVTDLLSGSDATSGQVNIALKPFAATVMAHVATDTTPAFLRVRASEPVQDPEGSTTPLAAYVYNMDDGTIIAKNDQMVRSWDYQVDPAQAASGTNYGVWIAADTYNVGDSVYNMTGTDVLDTGNWQPVNFVNASQNGFGVTAQFEGTGGYGSDDPTPPLDWSVDDDIQPDGYAVYIADSKGNILKMINDGTTSGSVNLPRVYDAEINGFVTYVAYVAKIDPNAQTASDLTGVVASTPFSEQIQSWFTDTTDTTGDTLKFSIPQSLQSQYADADHQYGAYIYDSTTGTFVKEFTTNTSNQDESFSMKSGDSYQIYIAKVSDPNNLPASPSDLNGLEYTSAAVTAP